MRTSNRNIIQLSIFSKLIEKLSSAEQKIYSNFNISARSKFFLYFEMNRWLFVIFIFKSSQKILDRMLKSSLLYILINRFSPKIFLGKVSITKYVLLLSSKSMSKRGHIYFSFKLWQSVNIFLRIYLSIEYKTLVNGKSNII